MTQGLAAGWAPLLPSPLGSPSAALLPGAAVYSNSLCLLPDGSSCDSSPTASPLRQPLKSLAAAVLASGGAPAPPTVAGDGGHLIAPLSRAASFQECEAGSWQPAKQLDGRQHNEACSASAPGSPRIGALLRKLSQQLLPSVLVGGGNDDAAAPAASAAAAPYQPLALESSGSEVAGILTHASPAHLLAPAQPAAAALWADASPASTKLQLTAAPEPSWQADGAEQQQRQQQQQQQQHEAAEAGAQTAAAPPLLPQVSSLSSPSSGGYGPQAAAPTDGTQEPVWQQHEPWVQPAQPPQAPPPPLQQQQAPPLMQPREAGVRRSLADDFFASLPDALPQATEQQQQQQQQQPPPVPLQQDWQQQQERSIAGLHALAAAQQRQAWDGSPASAATASSRQQTAAGAAVAPAAAAVAAAAAVQVTAPEQAISSAAEQGWSADATGIDLDFDLLADCLPEASASASAPAAPAAAPAPVAAAAPALLDAAAADDQVLFASPAKCGFAGACSPGSPLSLALSGVPDAPAAGAAGWALPPWVPRLEQQEQQQPWQQLQQEPAWVQQQHPPQHVVGSGVAGEYARLAAQLERLDLRRIRRAVRASCKQQEADAAAAHAGRRASLLERLVGGCISGRAPIPRLRRGLERQRLHLLCLGRLPYDPDQPLHFQLFSAVCWGFTGLDAIEDNPLELRGALPAWQQLGCAAANPARELGDAGLLPLLLLLMALERAPRLAARLLAAALGCPEAEQEVGGGSSGGGGSAEQAQLLHCPAALPPFSLVEVATEATGWLLRLLGSGALNRECLRLGSATGAAEAFWLGSLASFLSFYEAVSAVAASSGGVDASWLQAQRLLLSVLVQAQGRACGDVGATVARGLRAG